jgi:hypothetical protein
LKETNGFKGRLLTETAGIDASESSEEEIGMSIENAVDTESGRVAGMGRETGRTAIVGGGGELDESELSKVMYRFIFGQPQMH